MTEHNLNYIGIYQFLQFYRLLKKLCDPSISLTKCENLAVTHFHSCWQNLVDYCYYSVKRYKTRKFQNYCCCFQSSEIMGHSKIMTMKDHSQPELDSHNSYVFIPKVMYLVDGTAWNACNPSTRQVMHWMERGVWVHTSEIYNLGVWW